MDPLEVDEHVPDARRAHGEGGGEENGIICSADQVGEPPRHVDVGGGEDSGLVELEQQPGHATREPGVEEVGHAASPRSRTSLSSSTSSGEGCQVNTPHGAPSTSGVSGPVIPRTKR